MSNAKTLRKLLVMNGLVACIAVTALILTLTNRQPHQPRIAFVDNTSVFNDYQGVKESTAMYQQKLTQWQAQLDTLENNVDRTLAQYRNRYNELSPTERQNLEQEIEHRKQQYFSYKEDLEQKAVEEDQKMTSTVLNQIDDYLHTYGEQSSYDYILGITEQGNVLFAKNENNITDEIIEGLNKTYSGQ